MTPPDDAACAGMDTELFVISDKRHGRNGTYSSPHTKDKIANALAICHSCPVINECREYVASWDSPPRDIIIAGLKPRDAWRMWHDAHHKDLHHHPYKRTA